MTARRITTGPPHWRYPSVFVYGLVSTVFWLIPQPMARAQPALQGELRAALSALPHPEARVGACIVDLSTGTTVFTENADVPLTPASGAKVFSIAAALAELGPEFSFKTLLVTDGASLLVIGDGDPAIGDEKLHRARGEPITADFDRWAELLLTRGVRAIPGDLVIDESVFDSQYVHPSWEKSDLNKWYAAPVGGLNFNDNCVDVTVLPAGQQDALVLVSIQPETALVKVINNCRSGGHGKPLLHHRHDTFEYRITGRCSKRWRFDSVSFPDPGLLFADSLRTVLKNKGVALGGTIRRGRVRGPDGGVPASLTIVGRRRTALADVLRRAGNDSQNVFGECLLKRAGYAWAKRHGAINPQGTWSLGKEAVIELLARANIDARGLLIADGSGLSRENACTARQLAELLAWMDGQPSAGLLHGSLAVAGADGSLRKRLSDLRGRVRAKTGTMRGVRTLAGYVVGADGRPAYAFAVMFNGYKGPSAPYKQIQDRVCRILANAADDGSAAQTRGEKHLP